jgi:hypothetical protein
VRGFGGRFAALRLIHHDLCFCPKASTRSREAF